jgi:hypothetical protein
MKNEPQLASDLLWGAAAIAAELGVSPRRVYWLLVSKHVPAKKVGNVWVGSRRALRQHLIPASNQFTGEVGHG